MIGVDTQQLCNSGTRCAAAIAQEIPDLLFVQAIFLRKPHQSAAFNPNFCLYPLWFEGH